MIDAGQVILSESVSTTDTTGDELEATVREQARLVYKIAYSVLRNHHDAEDVAQETFLRFLRQRKRWAEIRDRRAWLAAVAWRVALDRKRMPAEVALEEAAEVVSKLRADGAPVDEIAASRQMMSLLERLVSSLPRDLRAALILSATEELTSAEISQVLGIPEGSVRTRLLRAREILREKLAALLEHKHARRRTRPIRERIDRGLAEAISRRRATVRARDANLGRHSDSGARGAASRVGLGRGGMRRNIGCYRFDAAFRLQSTSTTHTQRLAAPAGHNTACATDGLSTGTVAGRAQTSSSVPQGCDTSLTSGAISHSLATHGAREALVGVPRQSN